MSQEDGRKVVQEARVPRVHHRDEERLARVPRAERAADEALVVRLCGSYMTEHNLLRLPMTKRAPESSEDVDFAEELKAALAKPEKWYLERVDKAVKGARLARRRPVRVPREG